LGNNLFAFIKLLWREIIGENGQAVRFVRSAPATK